MFYYFHHPVKTARSIHAMSRRTIGDVILFYLKVKLVQQCSLVQSAQIRNHSVCAWTWSISSDHESFSMCLNVINQLQSGIIQYVPERDQSAQIRNHSVCAWTWSNLLLFSFPRLCHMEWGIRKKYELTSVKFKSCDSVCWHTIGVNTKTIPLTGSQWRGGKQRCVFLVWSGDAANIYHTG